MSRDPELVLLEPNTEIIQCSVCDELIWSHRTDPITARMSLPSHPWPSTQTTGGAFAAMKQAADEMYLQTVAIPSEEACRAHLAERHPLRLWIWERYGWDRVLRKWLW